MVLFPLHVHLQNEVAEAEDVRRSVVSSNNEQGALLRKPTCAQGSGDKKREDEDESVDNLVHFRRVLLHTYMQLSEFIKLPPRM